MKIVSDNKISVTNDDANMLRMLDRGIDDMEESRELLLDESFQKISELRNIRRNARL